MAPPSLVRVEKVGRIATVILDRPDKLNALDRGMLTRLAEAFAQLETQAEVQGILVTGAGDRAFAAGADIEEISKLDGEGAETMSRAGQEVFHAIERLPKPVLAAVNGHALGGGCELAMACHLRIASAEARFGLPEVRLGLIPGYGGTVRLARLVGLPRALELILTGESIDAERAREIGLVNQVVPAGELLERARDLMERILENAPLALAAALQSVYRSLEAPGDEGFRLEAESFGRLASTHDMREGVRAFLEKRQPRFEGK